jgi:hypothetical protein
MPSDEQRVPRLVVTAPAEQAGRVFELAGTELVIGHSDTADLVLEDRYVSRRHALLTTDAAGEVTLWDLNSTAGTQVNGAPLVGPRVLRRGDLVQFADFEARFEPASAVRTAPVPVPEPEPEPVGAVRATDVKPEPECAPGPPTSTAPPVPASAAYTVTGTVASPALPGIGGLTVELIDKNVGGDESLATTKTTANGSYAFPSVVIPADYFARHHKKTPDFQVTVSAGGNTLASSTVSYSAPAKVTLDVVLPAGAAGLPSEYETLTANLASAYPGSLGALQENATRQDITYLANKTGWDARAVALAALADQFGQITAAALGANRDLSQTQVWPVPSVSLRPEFYYALFRAGLPTNPDGLFQAGSAQVQSIWTKAMSTGVIPAALAKDVPDAVTRFQALSAAHLLTAPPPAGLSTMQEMLAPTLTETAQQETFAQLYAQHQGDWSSLWTAVTQSFGSTVASELQLTGQLYYLTINNAPLVSALLNAEANAPMTSTLDLAGRGYYEAAAWTPLIGTSVPPGLPGGTAAEQAANYAQLMAAQVRVAYPTAVLADQVTRGVIPVVGNADTVSSVAGFLNAHQADFTVSVEPVEGYLARTGVTGTPAEVVTQVKRLQRAYQLTPDDTSMSVLLQHGLDSAFAVTRYDQAGFVRAFAGKLGGADVAAAVHNRGRQIFSSTLGIAMSYLNARIGPTMGGYTNPVQVSYPAQAAPPTYPVTAYATLEDLFGSLDYCNCSDCNSVLSPAAYLVDLLNYIDQPAPSAKFDNPQDVLLQRRPDLEYLPLTCANTNTALPYIDLVNETLEYIVANDLSIAGYQGHDTSATITSAELVACPQYIDDAAYTILQTSYFPPPLPYNRPLALLRLQLQNLNLALPAAMTALRADDRLTSPVPNGYGWQDILIEQLTISRDEFLLFSDPDLKVGLGELYGVPDSGALSTLQGTNLQDLSRRLSVSYDDLVSIIATRFINPNAALIPLLQQLNAPFPTLKALHDNLGTAASIEAEFKNALPAGLDATPYGGTTTTDYQAVVDWVTSAQNYPLIMDIITIANPTGNIDDCSGSSLYLQYSNPVTPATALSGADYLKLIRFIRFWQTLAPLLGDPQDAVTIAQTDAIISALYPAADVPADTANTAADPANRAKLDSGFQTLLLRTGFLFQLMNLLSLTGDGGLAQLLACWAPIGTVGQNSLYQSMFLTPTLLQQDPGAQTATVSTTVNTGDSLATAINGVPVLPAYVVTAGQNATTVAAAIAASINACTTPDPATGLALNARFYAAGQDDVITIKAGFTLTCVSSGPTAYPAPTGTPVSQSTTVAGTVTAGDTLTTTINGAVIPYQVVSGDSAATVATAIALAVNSSTAADPYTGLPLNSLVAATSNAGALTFTTVNAGAPFTLSCTLASANAGTYTAVPPTPAAWTATLAGSVTAGDVLTTTVNSVPVAVTAVSGDTPSTLAAKIAAAISGSASADLDPATNLPLSSEVQATSNGATVLVSPIDPSSTVTIVCTVSVGGDETYTPGPAPVTETAAATVAGAIPAGATLTTTVNGLPIYYQAISGDTPATIASMIVNAVNAPTTATDPVSGLPIYQLVTASTAPGSGVVTLTAGSATIPFTLTAEMSAGEYTAGRQNPPFAADTAGQYLTDPAQTLFGHEPTLCAAGNLTGADFALITKALGYDASTPLTLDAVSAVFRYGWFAHTLSLSVLEFLQLSQCTGLNPFAPLDPASTSPVAPPAIRFVQLLNALSNSGLATAQALYLVWNQDDTGTYAPTQSVVTGLAAALAADFAAVEAEFTVQVDPDGAIANSLMTLVYGATATDFFFGLLNSTFSTSTPYSVPVGQSALPATVAAASAGRLGYDDLAKQLTFAGLLDQPTVNAIDAASTDPNLPTAITALAAANQQAIGPFFTAYPELLPLYTAFVASTDPVQTKRQTLLDGFLPVLKLKRKQEQALASVTSTAGTDPSFAGALLQDPTILHADADATLPAIYDLTAVENQGLSAAFYLGDDLTAAPGKVVDCVPTVSYARTATVGGAITVGDILKTTINTVTVSYQVQATDTSTAILAAGVAAAVNVDSAVDSASNLPISQLVTATSDGPVITIAGLDPSAVLGYFTLTTAVSGASTETYTTGSQLPTGTSSGAIAGVWSGYLAVAQSGFYDVNIAVDPGAAITLEIAGAVVPGPTSTANGLWSNLGPITLTAGQLIPITLTAGSIRTTFSVSWTSQGLGWQAIPTSCLYPLNLVNRLGDTYVRFLKATSLASGLSLAASEIAYLGTATGYSVNTADATAVAVGAATFTPASMTNIAVGSALVIDDATAQETVTVTAVTSTTFSAVAANAHDGASAPFAILSRSVPALSRGWLNFLTAQGDPDQTTATALCGVLAAMLDFARIKQALSPTDQRLLAVIANPPAVLPNNQPALLSLTGWAQSSVNALLTRFFGSASWASLSSVENFRRVFDAYAIVQACGLSAPVLIPAVTNAPTPNTVSALQSALRAQYAESDWLTVVTPINDTMRIQQRDALVAYVVQQLGDQYAQSLVNKTTTAVAPTGATSLTVTGTVTGTGGITDGMLVQGAGIAPGTSVSGSPTVTTVTLSTGTLASLPNGSPVVFIPPDTIAVTDTDSLYEYLLIDSLTQPPVLTSRILLALSTTQLFVERVVRNLEPLASPADVNASEWEWMKRYRVWQANREVFLWPENWLYPELRNNQSPIFQEIMGSLLQGDITNDAAITAYLNYLTSLEEVAKMEPCGLYYQPATPDANETAYVVSRTAGAKRKHYFRELSSGAWTPWEEVKIDCEDLPLTPIVWNGRLFLFWLKAIKQAAPAQTSANSPNLPSPAGSDLANNSLADLQMSDLIGYSQTNAANAGAQAVQVQAVLCWSEYYNGAWQPMKTSDLSRPTTIGNYDASGAGSFEACRGMLRIAPATFTEVPPALQAYDISFSLPPGALILAVTDASGATTYGGFILHNTHSLPIRFEDLNLLDPYGNGMVWYEFPFQSILDQPSPTRSFVPSPQPYDGRYTPGTFGITYQSTVGSLPTYTNQILDYSWTSRQVDCQPGLPGSDAWVAPFFYEDRRNLFYVTTIGTIVPIQLYAGFGILQANPGITGNPDLPALVLDSRPKTPAPAEILAANAAAGGLFGVQQFVDTSPTIDAALASTGTITYQGQVISPLGSIPGRDRAAGDAAKGA